MRYYFKITRGYYAWYVGKGAFCFASVDRWLIVALAGFVYYLVKVWRHKSVNTLPYEYHPKKYPPPPDAESVKAAAWPDDNIHACDNGGLCPGMFTVDNTPPGPILSQHWQPDEAAAVSVLTGKNIFTPRPGIEYHDCPECGQLTYYEDHYEARPGGGCTAHYTCENDECGHTETFSA